MKSSAAAKSNPSHPQSLANGRKALEKQQWSVAVSHLCSAEREQVLKADDLLGLSIALHLIGRDTESIETLARAHQRYLTESNLRRAARCAFWLGYIAQFNGDIAQSNGWLARSRRLLEGLDECAEHGYLLIPSGIRAFYSGETEVAYQAFVEATAIGERCGDKDLATLALHGQGRALVRRGEIAAGCTLLDEAMVAVSSGEVSPIVAGKVYCSLIESCRDSFDMRRAREWTAALDAWCASQPEKLVYRGACLIHRSELLQLQGNWSEAMIEANRVRGTLSDDAPKQFLGASFYRAAELHRLQGNFAEAETAYQEAAKWERTSRPGLARLRLAQGKLEAANAAISLVLNDVRGIAGRPYALEAAAEIALARKDIVAARAYANELHAIATRHGAPALTAISNSVTGAVLLAEGDPQQALELLRQSCDVWRELDAPYETARARVLIGRNCRELGNEEYAKSELSAAREVFERLGALPDVAAVDCLSNSTGHVPGNSSHPAHPLTDRELEVLQLVASGATNREVANRLHISEKTVARHISNIFNKLDLSSRAAATAYAFQHGLV
jgi:ATP/maltotriose-dependent transcriptional regulator MalT